MSDEHDNQTLQYPGPKADDYDGFPGEDREAPWKDEELLRSLYLDKRLSMNQIRKGWGCSLSTVSTWIRKHGIERRSRSEAANVSHSGYPHIATLGLDSDNYMRWTPGDHYLSVHRLLAVAEWGTEAVKGMHVHHKNGIRWDNRIENLELVTNADHQRKHLKVEPLDRIRIAEMYEHGDISSRNLAELVDYDITQFTVLSIHKEFYDD